MIDRCIQRVLESYRDEGCPTGGFLQAVLSNDLFGAFKRADLNNRATMYDIVSWCFCELPRASLGSRKAYKEWVEMGGCEGLRKKLDEDKKEIAE